MKHNIAFTTDERGSHGALNIVWVTDLHLDAANHIRQQAFLDLIATHQPHVLLIGGDIANGRESIIHLERLAHHFQIPCFFVLGNHDYYYESIQQIREKARELCKKYEHLNYLTHCGVTPLSKHTALIGHDGWSDGRAGDFLGSDVMLNDYLLIQELKGLKPKERLEVLNRLGDEAAEHILKTLKEAFQTFDHAILLLHTPPFRKACYYGAHPSDDNWSPHFVCQAVGDAILKEMTNYPDHQLLVLCGHTHTGIDVNILPNLRVLAGESVLGTPSVQGIIYVN